MEEKKIETKKLSYEQLEQVTKQLSEQNNQLIAKIQEYNLNNVFKRLDYLFKVIENHNIFNQEFVTTCINEIENIMTIPDDEKSDSSTKEETT